MYQVVAVLRKAPTLIGGCAFEVKGHVKWTLNTVWFVVAAVKVLIGCRSRNYTEASGVCRCMGEMGRGRLNCGEIVSSEVGVGFAVDLRRLLGKIHWAFRRSLQ